MANTAFHFSTLHLHLHHQNQLHHHFKKYRRPNFQHNFSATHLSSAVSPPCHLTRARLRDSNAESYTNQSLNDSEDDFSDDIEQVFDEYIDSIWIFKVFGSYGWASPIILISMLLATGLKAFLLALAIPIGQSTFAFAFEKMQNSSKKRPQLKSKKTKKTKKKTSRAYRSRNVKLDDEVESDKNLGTRKKERGYKSWFSKNDDSVGGINEADFGGWYELDAGVESKSGHSRRQAQKSSGRRGTNEKRKLSDKWVENESTPLLLRLLISIFPFLEFLE